MKSVTSERGWLAKLSVNPSVRQLREVLSDLGSKTVWWELAGERPRPADRWDTCRRCSCIRRQGSRATCQSAFLSALDRARRIRVPVQFACPSDRYTVCFPVVTGDQVRGYVGICNLERPAPEPQIKLAQAALSSVLREGERAEEMKTLSETIQPRCVALSTIHTIHRLISSTLNLEELLPRIARLCCQVLRAQECVIWLMDREKQVLTPRAVVELQKGKKAKVSACRVGEGLAGQTASTLRIRMTPRMMVVPLVEEDCLGILRVRRFAPAKPFAVLDQEILTTLAEQAVVAIRNAQMYETQERVTWGTIRSLSAILDGMDTYAPGRATRTKVLADVALAIADEMKVPPAQQRSLHYAALLHDAGRLGIPEEILRKPTKLNPAELAKVREHTVKGARLLEPLEILEPAIPIILYHHERWDGTGYPKGLKKEAIPLGARILAVANAFEAMVCERPYRRAMSIGDAAQEIRSHRGTQFDPKVVDAFLEVVRKKKLEEIIGGPGHPANGDGGSAAS
ncbi:MAG: HD domain-containing protein [Candidatus Omnitrophica bacterium]|nr:HD domain-containing protein [Candidatus Omnitrophota bacterium]